MIPRAPACRLLPVAVAIALLIVPGALAAGSDPLAGLWTGALDAGGVQLRLVLHVEHSEEGGYSGTLDSIDQGAKGLPLSQITVEDRSVSFALTVAGASYRGTLSPDGQTIDGTWSQGGVELPLRFARTEKEPELVRPQEPKPPFPYRAEEVRFESEPDVTLAGTLTLPPGDGPHPAVVLISGSGPQDRDETVFGHRPFLVLADRLTRRGVAVLRYDDRGIGASSGDFASATTEDLAKDAAAAIAFLKTHEGIDAARIGLAGHSEGGVIAPLVARDRDDVAFAVLIAGTGVTGADLLVEQSARILAATGAPNEAVEQARAFQREVVDFVLSVKEDELGAAVPKLAQRLADRFAELTAQQREALGLPKGNGDAEAQLRTLAERQAQQLLSPWFRFFLAYDPAPALRALRCPVLAIVGEKDVQVPADQNLPPIAAALAAAPTHDWTVAELPGLNHLLQTAETGSPTEYARIEETIAPAALATIGDWIARRTGLADAAR